MDAKKIKLSLLILASLIILSFGFFSMAQENSSAQNIFMDSDQDGLSDQEESLYGTDPRSADTDRDGYSDGAEVSSGYDPLKPSPGDKIIVSTDTASASAAASSTETNLTKEVAQKVASLTSANDEEDPEITMDQVKELVDSSLNQTFSEDDLPTVSLDEIKVKKQNYSKLSDSEENEKKKEDFTDYIVAVYYILASNSPKPIHASDTMNSLADSITQEIVSAIEAQDSSQLSDLSVFGEKTLEQLKDIEVPEEMVEAHLKALRFAKYAIALKDSINPNETDPLSDIAQFSKIEGLLSELMSFSTDVGKKFTYYGLSIDDKLKDKVNSLGVEIPIINSEEDSDSASNEDE
jgi:hypothetical protein